MTRRDYLEIATTILEALRSAETEEEIHGIYIAARAIGDLFASRSVGFDMGLFMLNCGLEEHHTKVAAA